MTAPIAPDVPSSDTFGPALINYDAVEDPETDLDMTSWNLVRAQLAAISATAVKAWVHLTVAAGVLTLESHGASWNESGNLPTVNRVSAGLYTVTWPDSVYDFQATPEAHTVTLKTVLATPSAYPGTTATLLCDAYVQGNARSVVITTKTTAGTATDVTHLHVEVRLWAGRTRCRCTWEAAGESSSKTSTRRHKASRARCSSAASRPRSKTRSLRA